MEGKKIFSKHITILENPHKKYMVNSGLYDDEGVKTTKKYIFKNGVFKNAIYCYEDAIQFKEKPTGNGFRTGFAEAEAKLTNVIIKPGDIKISEMIEENKDLLIIEDVLGLHTSNIITGDFAVTAHCGVYYKQGKRAYGIKNANIGGNIIKLLSKDVRFSKETETIDGCTIAPYLLIQKAKII